jgi:dienelactone hydrolase
MDPEALRGRVMVRDLAGTRNRAVKLALAAVLLVVVADAQPQTRARHLQTAADRRTEDGVRFGFVGPRGPRPAPLMFMFGGERRGELEGEGSNLVGWLLAQHGFAQASLDIPCFGDDARPGEPAGMSGWRARLEKGEPLFAAFQEQVRSVVGQLARDGTVDPERVGVCGVSRGGFVALHVGAAEPRMRFIAVFAPVTDLLALREFHGIADPAPARALDVMTLADKLRDRPLWISIADQDERVDSRHAIEFALHMMRISARHRMPMTHFWSGDDIRLTVTPSEGANGHSSYRGAHEDAAAWILRQYARP